MGRAYSYREAADHIVELKREWGSHLTADLEGWSFVASFGEVMAMTHAQAFFSRYPIDGKPYQVPTPWDNQGAAAAPLVTTEERDALRAQLIKRSAFRDQ